MNIQGLPTLPEGVPTWVIIFVILLWAGDKFLLPKVLDFKTKTMNTHNALKDDLKKKCSEQIKKLETELKYMEGKYRSRDHELSTHLIQISTHFEMILTLVKDDLDDKPEGYKKVLESATETIQNFKEEIKKVNENNKL